MLVITLQHIYVGRSVGRMAKSRADIDSPSKRARLPARRNPYWLGVSGGRGGVSLGYRKPIKGQGAWIAKVVIDGNRVEEKIGLADDDGAGIGALNYRSAVAAALTWSQQQNASIQARATSGMDRRGPTVRNAIERYVSIRKSHSERDGKNAEGRLRKHVLSDDEFADLALAKLRSSDIHSWRQRATSDRDEKPALQPSTLNRLLNDLRAALNAAVADRYRELPASLPTEIRVGTKANPAAANARKQVLADAQVADVVKAAFGVDEEGDFGRLVLVAAATGGRHSQLRALTVADVQADRGRIMLPASMKGRARQQKPPIAIPVSNSVIDKLTPAIDGRRGDEPLLTRWAYRRSGRLQWVRSHRRAWGAAYEIEKPWAEAVRVADLPSGTVAYALRHSSIVRGLRAGMPIRLVAALHDTSSQMIEKHYSAFIIDATEELARRSALHVEI